MNSTPAGVAAISRGSRPPQADDIPGHVESLHLTPEGSQHVCKRIFRGQMRVAEEAIHYSGFK